MTKDAEAPSPLAIRPRMIRPLPPPAISPRRPRNPPLLSWRHGPRLANAFLFLTSPEPLKQRTQTRKKAKHSQRPPVRVRPKPLPLPSPALPALPFPRYSRSGLPPDETARKDFPAPKGDESIFVVPHPVYLEKSQYNTVSVDTQSEDYVCKF